MIKPLKHLALWLALLVAVSYAFTQKSSAIAEDGTNQRKEAPSPLAKPTFATAYPPPLTAKKHFSYKPIVAPGSQFIAMHYIEFPAVEVAHHPPLVRARVFLIAFPQLVGGTTRIRAEGVEIEHHGSGFVPDLTAGAASVQKVVGTACYRVDLGGVVYTVNTTRAP